MSYQIPIITTIRYYNVLFYLQLKDEKDIFAYKNLDYRIVEHASIRMRDIAEWCLGHQITYHTKFCYRKDFPFQANIWNLYCYLRFCFEQKFQNTYN